MKLPEGLLEVNARWRKKKEVVSRWSLVVRNLSLA